jgi:hypothetical protein
VRDNEAFCCIHIMCKVDRHQTQRKNNCNEDDTINGNLSEINYSCRVTWIWQFFCPEQFNFCFVDGLQPGSQPTMMMMTSTFLRFFLKHM